MQGSFPLRCRLHRLSHKLVWLYFLCGIVLRPAASRFAVVILGASEIPVSPRDHAV